MLYLLVIVDVQVSSKLVQIACSVAVMQERGRDAVGPGGGI